MLSTVLAVALTEDDPKLAATTRTRLRQWVQQRDVVEFLEPLSLLAAPYGGGCEGLDCC